MKANYNLTGKDRKALVAAIAELTGDMMQNRHYLGDDFYPAIIDQETFDKAEAIRLERAGKLGRLNRVKESKPEKVPTYFRITEAEQHYDDPSLQAEYLYSLIESEAI